MNTGVILWAGEIENSRRFIVEARGKNFDATVMFGDGKDSEYGQGSVLEEIPGALMSAAPDLLQNKVASDVVDKLKAKDIKPTSEILRAYAAVQVIAQSATAAKSVDPNTIAERIYSGMVFTTVLGDISYDKKGDLANPGYAMYSWVHRNNGISNFQRQ